jgi:hypothetical protein
MAAFEESAAPTSTPVQEFYTWTFPGAPVRIHLHLNVVESLGREVRRAFEAVPSHSVEIGGILYGRADFATSPIIEIRDFEPFLCEYRADHKFILSDSDQRKLDRLLSARRADGPEALAVVGYYRAHIGDGLSLRAEDVALAQAHFCDPANVFLVVKPAADGSASAGFFFWDNGRIDPEFSFLEFPFDARQLTGARVKPSPRSSGQALATTDPLPEPQGHAEHEAPAIAAESPAPLETEALQPPRRGRNYSVWSALLFALLMIGLGVLGYQGYLAWAPRSSAARPGASDTLALALQVERKGPDLRVSWNRSSAAIMQATDGVLSIRDGDSQQQELKLDADQLRTGSVTYTPATAAVRFRLEVTTPGNIKTSETVLALTAARPEAPAGSHAPASGPSPQSDAAAANSPGSGRSFGEPMRVTTLDAPAPTSAAEAPAALQPKAGPQETSSVLYLPPRPVRQVQPEIPRTVRKLIASQIEVPVKVWISSTGVVEKAEAQPTGQLVSSTLVTAAQRAALRWRFAPAVRGTETVASEMILKFQYQPVQ